jgi:hypothetical protein
MYVYVGYFADWMELSEGRHSDSEDVCLSMTVCALLGLFQDVFPRAQTMQNQGKGEITWKERRHISARVATPALRDWGNPVRRAGVMNPGPPKYAASLVVYVT